VVATVQTTNGRKGRAGSDWYLHAFISASNLLTKELKYDRFFFFPTTSWCLKACFHMPQNVFRNSVKGTLWAFTKQLFQRQFQLKDTKNRDAIILESPVLKTGPIFHILLNRIYFCGKQNQHLDHRENIPGTALRESFPFKRQRHARCRTGGEMKSLVWQQDQDTERRLGMSRRSPLNTKPKHSSPRILYNNQTTLFSPCFSQTEGGCSPSPHLGLPS